MGFAGHVAQTRRCEIHAEWYSGNMKGRDHFADLAVDGNNINVYLK
jgi:hypothetical protein